MRRGILRALVLAPLAFAALIGAQLLLLSRRRYLPADPGYRVDRLVRPAGSERSEPALELVVLGDSTVAGVGAPSEAESLPVLVAQRVADATGRGVHVVGHGLSGTRTASLVELQLPLVTVAPDVLLLVVGANDATHATPPPAFRHATQRMLARATATGAPVVLGSTPRFIGTEFIPQPLRWMLDAYSGLLRNEQRAAVAAAPGTRLVDLAAVAPRFAGVPEATSSDGFHPSPIGYGFWADALASGVVAALAAA